MKEKLRPSNVLLQPLRSAGVMCGMSTNLKALEFNPDWLDENGFPSKLRQWLMVNTPNETVVYHGTYYVHLARPPLHFRIHRFKTTSDLPNTHQACFELSETTVLEIDDNEATIQSRLVVMPGVASNLTDLARFIRLHSESGDDQWILLEETTKVYQVRQWDYLPASPEKVRQALSNMYRAFFPDMDFREFQKQCKKSLGEVASKVDPVAFDWTRRELSKEMIQLHTAVANDRRLLATTSSELDHLQEKYRIVNTDLIRRLLSETN